MLVHAIENGYGRYFIDFCSDYEIITKEGSKKQTREIAMLDFLAEHAVEVPNIPIYTNDFHKKLEKLRKINVNRNFGFFDVQLSDSLKVDSVKMLTGFGTEIDSILIIILKESRWIDGRDYISRTQTKLPAGSHVILAFYYYPGQEKHASFVSEFDL